MREGKFRTLVALVELDHATGGRLLADLAKGKGPAARKLRKLRREVEEHPMGRAMLERMAHGAKVVVLEAPETPETRARPDAEFLAALPAASDLLH